MSASRSGFTLLEVLISTAVAVTMAGISVGAYVQVRKTILRSEALLAMHDRAQGVYNAIYRDLQATMPDCAMVIAADAGSVDLVAMRGKEDSFDYDPSADNYRSDLVWYEWRWKDGALANAHSTPVRQFTANNRLVFGRVDYRGMGFINLPQPRRWLDPAQPFATLDDNVYFPDASGASRADPTDIGDRADLLRNLAPVAGGVQELALQLVLHDGTVETIDGSAARTLVIPGAWMDGRLAPRLSDPPDYPTSAAAKRPELLRLRFTLEDPRIALRQTYSFSFALPGLTPTP
jgi:prepilin-type N-terminal cleavage/methylation domain-containing protein